MKHYLLNHQPQKGLQAACAQQGQAPTCNARGKGHTSASPKTLTKVILVLLTMFLLPSAAWADYTYGGQSLTFYYQYDSDPSYYYSGSEDNKTIEWNANTSAGYQSSQSAYTSFTDLRFTYVKSLTGLLSSITIGAGEQSALQNAAIKVFKLASADATDRTQIGTISNEGTTYTYNPTDGVQGFNNEYIQLAIEYTGDNQRFFVNQIKSITLTFSGEEYGISVGGHRVTSYNANNVLGDATSSSVSFNASTNTLKLNSATLGSYESNCQIISYLDNLTINLEGTNTIHGGISLVENAEGTLNFTGSSGSSLTINNVQNGGYSGTPINRFTSVDFGSFNLSSSSAPGVYYKTDKDDPNSYKLWTNHIGGGGSSVSNVTLTTQTLYNLWVGNRKEGTSTQIYTQVTADNKSAILGDSKISFDGSQTLTLSGAELTGSIISGLNALTIIVDKVNTINTSYDSLTCIRNIAPGASLTLQKSTNGTPSLSLTGGSVIGNFSTINYAEGGLYLHAYSGSDPAPDAYFSYEGLVGGATKAEFTTESLGYILKIGDTSINESVTINSGDNENDAIIAGSITFSIDENNNGILTLDNVTLSNDVNNKILSYLPNLTINIKGSCEIGKVISTYSNATLTLGLAKGANDESKLMTQIGNQKPFWERFAGTPTFNNNLCFLPNDDSEVVEKLPTPHLSIVDGGLKIGLSGSNLDQMRNFYSVDFVEGKDVELKEYNSDSPETIDKPCTVTAYTEFEDVFGVKRQSETVTGKYFGIADKTIILNNDTKGSELKIDDLEIIPAVAEGDGVTFEIAGSENTAVIQLSGTDYQVKGLGTTTMSVNLLINDAPFKILNEVATGNITVVPPAPTIVKDTKKDYLTTDLIKITQEEIDGFETTISYTWDEATAESPVWNTYPEDPEGGVPAQTGTLRARVEYSAGKVESAEATENFAVKIDLATAFVAGLENESYTGSAIVPTFTLKESETATTEISNANYDLSYEKKDETSGNFSTIESIIEVGTYKITATGKGDSYGGSLIISDVFKVIQAENAITKEPVSVEYPKYTGELMDLIVAGEATFGDIEYKIGEDGTYSTDIPQASAVGNYTIYYKVEGTENYSGCEEQSLTVSIDKGSFVDDLEITIEGWTYGNEPNEPVLTGKLGEGAVTWKYKYPNSENFVEEAPTATSPAGNYAIQAIVAETDNYYAGSTEAEFTIEQATIDGITLGQTELTFNGSAQTVTVTKVMAGTIEVAADYYEVSGNTGTEAGTYTVTVTAKLKNSDGSDFKNNFKGSATATFTINHRTIPAEVIAEKFTSEEQTYASFNNASESFLAPQGIVAYIITGVSGSSVTVKAVSYVKAGTPVLLQKTSTSTETEETTDDIFATNILKYAEGNLTANGGQYVLYKNEFVKATGSITSGKCYLDLTGTSFAGTRGFSIAGGAEGTTAISDAVVDSDHSEWFDLQGRKIEKPSKKGLYIRDGKKIVVK